MFEGLSERLQVLQSQRRDLQHWLKLVSKGRYVALLCTHGLLPLSSVRREWV